MKINLEFENALAGKRVFITGHTGFMGGWVCLWLKLLDAEMMGYSLPPESPTLFSIFLNKHSMYSVFDDICNYESLLRSLKKFKPDVIIHLAAQSLVRRGYQHPRSTFAVNTLGTVNILEAARAIDSVKAVVCVTTDKVYENQEWSRPYRENDPLGGTDPYSASKAAAEIVIRSYNAVYSKPSQEGPPVAAIRGGNIVGGGDWCENRLIPDFVRAVVNETSLNLRYPHAVRPWQHVLGLVQGCFLVLAGLISKEPQSFARAWNFGPHHLKTFSVLELINLMSTEWKQPILNVLQDVLPEAHILNLDSSMARNFLHWQPPWDTKRTIKETIAWYKTYFDFPADIQRLTLEQINTWRLEVEKCI
jgi:CDP-glucose 4,6-dehydratase